MAGISSTPARRQARSRRSPAISSQLGSGTPGRRSRKVSSMRAAGSGRTRIGWCTPLALMLAASSSSLPASKVLRGLVRLGVMLPVCRTSKVGASVALVLEVSAIGSPPEAYSCSDMGLLLEG